MAKAPSEKHLEDWIVANRGWIYAAQNPPKKNWCVIGRQVRLKDSRADLLLSNGQQLWVVELKKDTADGRTVSQIMRYMYYLSDIWGTVLGNMGITPPSAWATFNRCVQGMIIAHSIPQDVAISSAAGWISTYVYEFDDGTYYFNPATNQQVVPASLTAEETDQFSYGYIGVAMRSVFAEYKKTDGRFIEEYKK